MDEKSRNIIHAVEALAGPVLQDQGLDLVEVQFRRERSGWTLRLFIDRPPEIEAPDRLKAIAPRGSGVTLDDCVAVSGEIGDLLDLNDIIPGTYNLEVSSPGLDRPLKKPADFIRFMGDKIRITLKNPLNGQRKLKGRLSGFHEGLILLEQGGVTLEVQLDDTERVAIEPEF